MKRIADLLFVLSLFFSLWGCESYFLTPEQMAKQSFTTPLTDIYFGPFNEQILDSGSYSPKEEKKSRENPDYHEISAFKDSVQFAGLMSYSDTVNTAIVGSAPLSSRNRLPFSEGEVMLYVKGFPSNAAVTGFSVKSSDEDIVEVVSDKFFNGVKVVTRKSGDCTLTVTVKGGVNSVTREYPVRVVNMVKMHFATTPYWLGAMYTPVTWTATGLADEEHALIRIRDSVTVIGYCEAYDFLSFGRKPIIRRDTTTFRCRTTYGNMRKGVTKRLRNLTGTVRKYRLLKGIWGSALKTPPAVPVLGYYPKLYHYQVEQIIVNFDVLSEDNLYEFDITSEVFKIGRFKNYRSMNYVPCDTADEEATEEEEKEYDDGVSEEEEEFEQTVLHGRDSYFAKVRDYDLEEKLFFIVTPFDFLTQAQRDSIGREITKFKNDNLGDQGLTPEQQDSMLVIINDKMNRDRPADEDDS